MNRIRESRLSHVRLSYVTMWIHDCVQGFRKSTCPDRTALVWFESLCVSSSSSRVILTERIAMSLKLDLHSVTSQAISYLELPILFHTTKFVVYLDEIRVCTQPDDGITTHL